MQRPPWLGKLIGAGIGILAQSIPLFLLGLLIGHVVDSVRRVRLFIGDKLQKVQSTFFDTTFTLMGRIAKSDGHVSEREIAVTEQLMARMGLGAGHRQQAIALFKRGASADFDVDAQLLLFTTHCGNHPNLRQMLLMFLFSTAAADGSVSTVEHDLLQSIATRIGFSTIAFEQLLRMFAAQENFSNAPGAGTRGRSLAEAYTALGVEESVSDREVKQAYRRLMSQFHPDKLIAEGMPQDMIKMATERTQEIQNAWEQVRKARAI